MGGLLLCCVLLMNEKMSAMKKKTSKLTLLTAVLLGVMQALPLSAKQADSTYVAPSHSVFLEIGGMSGFAGIYYDMRLKKESPWGFRTGVSWAYDSEDFISSSVTKEHFMGFNTEMNYLIGGRRNHLELGLGNKLWIIKYKYQGPYYDDPDSYSINRKTWVRDMIYLNVGYRHEALHGFQFRCDVTPMIHVTHSWLWADGSKCSNGEILFAPYVSFGWAF